MILSIKTADFSIASLFFFFTNIISFFFKITSKLLITQNKSKRRTIKFLLFSQNLLHHLCV